MAMRGRAATRSSGWALGLAAGCGVLIMVAVGIADLEGLALALTFFAVLFLPSVFGLVVALVVGRALRRGRRRGAWPVAAAVTMAWGLGWASAFGRWDLTHDVSDHPTQAGRTAAYVAAIAGGAGVAFCVAAVVLYVLGRRGHDGA